MDVTLLVRSTELKQKMATVQFVTVINEVGVQPESVSGV